jgi:hypothetical protein
MSYQPAEYQRSGEATDNEFSSHGGFALPRLLSFPAMKIVCKPILHYSGPLTSYGLIACLWRMDGSTVLCYNENGRDLANSEQMPILISQEPELNAPITCRVLPQTVLTLFKDFQAKKCDEVEEEELEAPKSDEEGGDANDDIAGMEQDFDEDIAAFLQEAAFKIGFNNQILATHLICRTSADSLFTVFTRAEAFFTTLVVGDQPHSATRSEGAKSHGSGTKNLPGAGNWLPSGM